MPNIESSFGKRVERRAEDYEQITRELAKKAIERTKNAFKLLVESPFYIMGGGVEIAILAANKGKEAVQKSVEAIKTGADKAKEFGRNKKEQASNFLRSVVEAGKTKVRDARDGLVDGVNKARGMIRERINQMKERRAQRQIERIERAIDEHLRQIGKLSEEREKIRAYLESLTKRFQPYAA